ncbi:hypothetical protein L226DRAFT_539070 [Lentinus tigrinus ALCF2SS1-7]|uniref:uncharacterized protein n=1 Tax=Lentinus tigrinus ALCF2SS1-7 TaxID=1328758 RepID=UPI001165DA75|nr:hypothetical protein L226DRAFT_539070 [Lentinus tigrinus ALCF2SS1-7]
MRQILTRCTSLCSLAAVNYCSWPLTGLTGAIPSSVSSLTLGPAHEPINFCSLPCARNLRTLNSINTYMDDSEIYAFVTGLSALRTVRRIFTYPPDSSAVVGFAFQQIGCFYPSSSAKRAFERLEIVCYGKTEDEAERDMENEARQWQCDPAQVTLVPRVWVTNNGQKDYFATLFEAWEREAYDASGIRISS